MYAARFTGIAIVVIGLIGAFTGGFSFMQDDQWQALQGALEHASAADQHRWLSILAVALGAVMLGVSYRPE